MPLVLQNISNKGGLSLSGVNGRFSSIASSGAVGVVTNGLIYYLDAGRTASYPGSGTAWNDLSGFANTSATLVNGPTFDATGNGSLVFDGSNDYASLISAEGRTKFTIGLWVKTTTNASNGLWYLRPTLIGKELPGQNVGDFAITISGGYLGYWIDEPVNGIYQSSTLINDGTWKYVVVTSDGTNSKMYLNGQFLSDSTLGVNPLSANPFQLCANTNRGIYTAASIGSVTFYNRALTPSEIVQNYNAQWGPSAFTQPATTLETGLLIDLDAGNPASYPGSGTTWTNLADGTGYRNASFSNAPTFDSANGGSLVFDGTRFATIAPVAGLPSGNRVRTLSGWFNPASSGSLGKSLFGIGANTAPGVRTNLWLLSDGTLGYEAVNTGLFTSFWPGLNNWVHLTAVIVNDNSHNAKIYINGVRVPTTTFGSNVTLNTSETQCTIGGVPGGTELTSYFYSGKVGSVRMWNRTLSDAEVYENFNSTNRFSVAAPTTTTIDPGSLNKHSITFDGNGDYVTVPYDSGLQLTGDFTIETWVKTRSQSTLYPAIFTNYSSGVVTGVFGLFASHQYNRNKYQLYFAPDFPAIQSTANIQFNVWQHIALVRSGSVITMYLDGVAQGTYTNSGTIQGTQNSWWLGTAGDTIANGAFNGKISNFRVVKGTALYTSNFTPSTQPLEAISGTQLLLAQRSDFVDGSSVNRTVRYFGNASISTDDPFTSGSLVPGAIPTDGLVMHLDAGNRTSYPGSGSAWYDLSGNLNHTILVNGPTFDPTFNSGSIVFDGVNDYASTISGEGLSHFTIGLWVKTTSTQTSANSWTWASFFGKETNGFGAGDLGITVNNGQLGYFSGLASGVDQANSWTTINDGLWKHVILTSNGTNTRLYLNGQFINGSSFNVNKNLNGDPFRIGSAFQGTPVTASIGSVVFYDRPLTDAEIAHVYSVGWGTGT